MGFASTAVLTQVSDVLLLRLLRLRAMKEGSFLIFGRARESGLFSTSRKFSLLLNDVG
jgi:hypothetical protein